MKRVLSLILALVMLVSMVPISVFSAKAVMLTAESGHDVDTDRLCNTITVNRGQLDSSYDGSIIDSDIYGYVINYPLKKGHALSISNTDYVFSVRKLVDDNYSTLLKQATTDSFTAAEDMTVAMLIRKPDKSALTAEELASIVIYDSQYGMIGVEGYAHRFTVEAETIEGGTATTRAAIFLPDSYTASGTPTRFIIMTNGGSAYLTESSWQGNTEANRNLVKSYLQNGYAVLLNDNTAGKVVNSTSEMVPDLGCLQQLSGLMKSYEYVCNALNLERKFSIHARSQGTFVGIHIMRQYPELVKCALITGPNVSAAHRWTVIANKDHTAKRFGFSDLTGSTFEADKFVGNDIYTDMAAEDYSLPPTFWMESNNDVCPNSNKSIYEVVERLQELGCTAEYQKFSSLTHSETCRLASEEATAAALAFLEKHQERHIHSYTTTVTAPTCTEQGYTTYTCACGDSYVGSDVDAAGHSYADSFCTICGAEEKVEPMFMQYDDHLDVTGKTVEILDAGDSIVRAEGNYLVAAGIGTARVKIDDTTYEITVGKAKLNLVMVIGQSNSGNHFPNATSKVTCPPGTAYYWKYAATEPDGYTQPSMGFHAPLLAELYAQSVAAGEPVKNVLLWEEGYTSKNGQSMTAWAVEKDGAINTDGTNGAAEMIRDCLAYYEQHSDKYEIVNKLVFCNHGTTDHTMDPQRYIRLFTAMWERLKAEGMEYLAFLRVRGAHSLNTPENADTYYNAASSAQFEMVRNREDMFMATTLAEAWTGPVNTAHSIDICNYITVMETYGQAAEYSDSYGNKASYADGILTTTMKELYGSNNKVHYGIFGYGLIGADAAYNMYAALNGNRAATVTQTDSSGLKSAEHISSMGSMQTLNIEDLAYNLSFYPTCGSPKGTMHIMVTAEDMDITEKVVSSETSTFGTINTEALRGYVHPVITVSYTYGGKTESVTYTLEFDHPCNSGHGYESVVTPPTCTEQGYTTYTCHCGNSYVNNYVEALGHRYGEWTVTIAPTCTETGVERRDCENCDHNETRSVAASGHDYESVVTPPTCTERGYTTHTCHCGSSFVDSYVDATGHHYGEWKVTTAPTCTEAGGGRRDCKNCGHYETRPVVATGHDYESVVTLPTCTEKGYTIHTCHCGDSYVDTYVDAAGHRWGEWKVMKEPAVAETGMQQRTCGHCGETEHEEIPKLEILYGDTNGDGTVNAMDLILLRQYLAGWEVTVAQTGADVNGDSTVNALDLIILRQYLAGWDVTLGTKT